MEQGSEEWINARLGKVTASRIADVMATTKTGPGASRKAYASELIAERLTGQPAERFRSPAMQWGTETEPLARDAYAAAQLTPVEQTGFFPHPTIPMAGASPDGIVGDDGLIEIKCPQTSTHIDFLRFGRIDAKYLKQMQFQMACTGRDWCDFVSYDPRLSDFYAMRIKRVDRDPDAIAEIEAEITAFLSEIDKAMAEIAAWAEP